MADYNVLHNSPRAAYYGYLSFVNKASIRKMLEKVDKDSLTVTLKNNATVKFTDAVDFGEEVISPERANLLLAEIFAELHPSQEVSD